MKQKLRHSIYAFNCQSYLFLLANKCARSFENLYKHHDFCDVEYGFQMFREAFKYYKSKNSPPDLNSVSYISKENISVEVITTLNLNVEQELIISLGLIPVQCWEVFKIKNKPGLIFIKNPFTILGQRYWIKRCLADFSKKPYKLNIDSHNYLENNEEWWPVINSKLSEHPLRDKLRWATLGYHHNWDTKVYSEDSKSTFPQDLGNMCEIIAQVLGFNHFEAQAAIVNYYFMNSTLSGHTDHSEPNLKAPLFSFSFGQSALFLIGGRTLDEPAMPIMIESGDILLMTEESRLCYHAVPLIMPNLDTPWNYENDEDMDSEWKPFNIFIKTCRLNINVRQVLNPGQSSLEVLS